jgi:hypothetical protein
MIYTAITCIFLKVSSLISFLNQKIENFINDYLEVKSVNLLMIKIIYYWRND